MADGLAEPAGLRFAAGVQRHFPVKGPIFCSSAPVKLPRSQPCPRHFSRADPIFRLPRLVPGFHARAASALGCSDLEPRQIPPRRRIPAQGGRHSLLSRGEADAQPGNSPGQLGDNLKSMTAPQNFIGFYKDARASLSGFGLHRVI